MYVHWRSIEYASIIYYAHLSFLLGDIIWLRTYQTQSANQYARWRTVGEHGRPAPCCIEPAIVRRDFIVCVTVGRSRASPSPSWNFSRKQQCASEYKTWTRDRLSCRVSFSVIFGGVHNFVVHSIVSAWLNEGRVCIHVHVIHVHVHVHVHAHDVHVHTLPSYFYTAT
jgi:hypothetical protein